jgi:TRAP-type C4-dicarboxylate transport system substrate-binding protein
MMRKIGILAASFLLFCGLAGPVFAQRKVVIKLASQVPENTPWGEVLDQLAENWSKATDGSVELRIYHGSQTDEFSMIRQLNQGQIQAAMLSTFGLKLIAPEVMTLSCPFLIHNNAELDKVMAILRPRMDKEISQKGYRTLAWSKLGWVHFFSKRPVFTLQDLQKEKIGTSDNQPELAELFKALGCTVVPVQTDQILVNLTGGQISAIYTSPISAASAQLFALAKNMADLNVAPYMGIVIMTKEAWHRIPARYRPTLEALTKQAEGQLDGKVQALIDSVMATMKSYHLVVNHVTDSQAQLWEAAVDAVLPQFIGPGKVFDQATYNEIRRILGR